PFGHLGTRPCTVDSPPRLLVSSQRRRATHYTGRAAFFARSAVVVRTCATTPWGVTSPIAVQLLRRRRGRSNYRRRWFSVRRVRRPWLSTRWRHQDERRLRPANSRAIQCPRADPWSSESASRGEASPTPGVSA